MKIKKEEGKENQTRNTGRKMKRKEGKIEYVNHQERTLIGNRIPKTEKMSKYDNTSITKTPT